MPQYQIEKISGDAPREWQRPQGGTIYYYKVKFVGIAKPVSIGKTKKDSLTIGQMVDGTIEPSDLQEDKFKAAPMAQSGFGGGHATTPNGGDGVQDSIARSVALKAAVDFTELNKQADVKYVLGIADEFLAWLKNESKPTSDEWGTPPVESLEQSASTLSPEELANIPF